MVSRRRALDGTSLVAGGGGGYGRCFAIPHSIMQSSHVCFGRAGLFTVASMDGSEVGLAVTHAHVKGMTSLMVAKCLHCVRTACALRAHCVQIVHTEARILTQEYLSPVH